MNRAQTIQLLLLGWNKDLKVRFSTPLTALIAILMLFFAGGCGGGGNFITPEKEPARGDLVSHRLLSTSSSLVLPYKVASYEIIYRTLDTQNRLIEASGLLTIPDKGIGETSPLLSYQHGTAFLDSDVPSRSSSSQSAIMNLAATGFIVSAPDYLGYARSGSIIHPYLHGESLANASLDMLRASRTMLKNLTVQHNEQLFLVGYSEGGYATLALQRAIQQFNESSDVAEFKVTASSAGGGPYDLSNTATLLANREINDKPAYMSFLLKAYNDIYALNQIEQMYQPAFVDVINSVFDGNHSGSEINNRLTSVTADLFEADFLNALRSDAPHIIKEKLALNDVYDWRPLAPTRLFHSPEDEIVPFANAVTALQAMRLNGADNVSLGECILDDHAECAVHFILDTLYFFSNYVKDL